MSDGMKHYCAGLGQLNHGQDFGTYEFSNLFTSGYNTIVGIKFDSKDSMIYTKSIKPNLVNRKAPPKEAKQTYVRINYCPFCGARICNEINYEEPQEDSEVHDKKEATDNFINGLKEGGNIK